MTEARCPCWHTIYSREVGQYRIVTDPHCSACGGTGTARFVSFNNPHNVVRVTDHLDSHPAVVPPAAAGTGGAR